MKKITLHFSAALLLFGLLPAQAMALTSTAQLNVNATTVQPAATINVAGAMAFGSVQDTGTANAQTSFTVTATNAWPYAISLDGGANYNAGAAKSFMQDNAGLNAREYVLYQNAGRTTVWGPAGANLAGLTGTGAAQTYTIYGSMLAAAGTSGAISDITTITVTY